MPRTEPRAGGWHLCDPTGLNSLRRSSSSCAACAYARGHSGGRQVPDVIDQRIALVLREVEPLGLRGGVQGRGGLMVTRDFQSQLVGAGAEDEVLQARYLCPPAEPADPPILQAMDPP